MFCAFHVVTHKLSIGVQTPKLTSIKDHYRKFLKNRREQNKTNPAANGISEEYGELEMVLFTITEEVDARRSEENTRIDAKQ